MQPSIEQVLDNLERRGYELIHQTDFEPQEPLSLPCLISAILHHYPEAYIINGLPVILSDINENEVEDLVLSANESSLQNPIGYFTRTVSRCLNGTKKGQNGLLVECSKALVPDLESEYVIPQGLQPTTIDHLKKNRTDIAREWNVVDYNREADFNEIIENYL